MFTLQIPNFPIQQIEIEHDYNEFKPDLQKVKIEFYKLEEANKYLQDCLAKKCPNEYRNYKILVRLKGEETLFFIIPHNRFLVKMPFLMEQFIMRSILQNALEGSAKLSRETIGHITKFRN